MIAALLLLLLPLSAGAAPIPASTFPAIKLDAPLQDSYVTGRALVLKGNINDRSKAGGQILFRFTPQSGGEAISVFLPLQGTRFEGYQIFPHERSGTYALDVFVGGPKDRNLSSAGTFKGLRVTRGSGAILLPADFFPGIALERSFAAQYRTGQAIGLSGRVKDPSMKGGQILFSFTPKSGNKPATQVFIDLDGDRFRRGHVFFHDQANTYDLDIFLGPPGKQLSQIGSYKGMNISRGSGDIDIPVDYFPGLVLQRPLPSRWAVGRPLVLEGTAGASVLGFSLSLQPTRGGDARRIAVPVEQGSFRRSVRLREGELGDIQLSVAVHLTGDRLQEAGPFPIRGIAPPPAPWLGVESLHLAIRPRESARLTLRNQGPASAGRLRYQVEGPFRASGGPGSLGAGQEGAVQIEYTGKGAEQGLLQILSDDPERPARRVALYGVASTAQSGHFAHARADERGRMELDLDFGQGSYLLVFYAEQGEDQDESASFRFALGGSLAAAKAIEKAKPPARTRSAKYAALQRNRELAALYQTYRGPAAKGVAANYKVGDRRQFTFPEMDAVSQQRVRATAVAVGSRAVIWVQDNIRRSADNLTPDDYKALADQFSREDYGLMVRHFGAPSDVDGDGKVSFLFTHLVDDVEAAGLYIADSVLPVEAGGSGDLTDLMYMSPTGAYKSTRATLAHELEHLINFNQHALVRRGESETAWLDEGLAHLAEDVVVGYTADNAGLVAEFFADPSSTSIASGAGDGLNSRGAGYLFVRSLKDRLGEDVIRRLVATGLTDRDNVEAATGEDFPDLLAFWGTQLYASGLGLSPHSRFNFTTTPLQSGHRRGLLPLPAAHSYRVGDRPLQSRLPARGLSFVEVSGRGRQRLRVEADPRARLEVAVVPLPAGFAPEAFLPPDYLPGLRFTEPLPIMLAAGRTYRVAGQVLDAQLRGLIFSFIGGESFDFEPTLRNGRFEQVVTIPDPDEYELAVFAGPGPDLEYTGGYAPVQVRLPVERAPSVGKELAALPRHFELGHAYPNPFNPSTTLPLAVPEGSQALSLEIYNALGQRVRLLHRGVLEPGWYRFIWDGRDDQGREVASGVYLYQMRSGEFRTVQRMVLVR